MACIAELEQQNFPPEIELISPTETAFQEGQGIPFTVYASDPEGDAVSVTFQSNVDGIFFEGVTDGEDQIQITASNLSVGSHKVLVLATDSAGQQADWSLEFSINGQPDSPNLMINPALPNTTDDLTLTIAEGLDPEGDTITHSILWKQNGAVIDDLSDSPMVTSDYTAQGDIWQATVTPSDGQVAGEPETISVEIGDSPPTLLSISIVPNSDVTTRSELECEATAEDIDGDEITMSYRWRRVINDIASEITIDGKTLSLTPAIGQPNDKYLCEVEAISNGLSTQDSTYVQIRNSPPTIGNTEIVSYGSIRAGESVFCNSDINDIDEVEVTSSTEWRLNDTQILGLEYTLELPENGVRAGDSLSCIITAQDSHGGEATESVEVIIENTPPVVDNISLSPSFPKTTDTINCTVTATDIDQDSIGFTYIWRVNGVIDATQNTSTFTGAINVNDSIRCTVTPNDGTEDGNSAFADATVINTPPSIQSLELSPADVYTNTNVIASVTASDIDGDSVSIGYAWYVNGDVAQQGTDSSLNGSYFEVGDEISVVATAYDGRDYGAAEQSSTVDVLNSLPVIQQHVLFSEDPIRRGAVVSCNADVDDNDSTQSLSINYLWQDQSGTVLSTSELLDIDDSTGLIFGDTISCTMTVDDGQDSAESIASTSIANSPPTIITASIGPETAYSQDELTCTAIGQDIDGQSTTPSYQWAVNGIATDETSNVFSHPFEPNDIASCFVSVSDGIDESTYANATRTIQNQVPVVENVTLLPLMAFANSTFQAIAEGTDPDGHALDYTYIWRVNGNIVQQNATGTLASSLLSAGDAVEVRVRADDSYSLSPAGISNTVTILNSPPSQLSIRVNPAESAPKSSALQCELLTPATDIDGDALSYSVTWTRNGAPYVGVGAVTRTTFYPGDTIPANVTENGDVWICELEVTDNITPPVTVTAQATIDCGFEYGNSMDCPALSCDDILDNDPSLYGYDGVYYIKPDSDIYAVYCDMTYDGGGWSLLMTSYVDGNSPFGVFRYDDNFTWETSTPINRTFLTSNAAATSPEFSKYQSYSEVGGEQMRLNVNWSLVDFNLFYDGMASQTALDVFSGPEILIQGDMSLDCHGELLSDLEVADFIPIGQGLQGFGINLIRTPETGSSAKVRFGIIHNSSSLYHTHERTIGIGTLTYSSRLDFKDPPSNCGNSGNDWSSTEPVLMDLWIR